MNSIFADLGIIIIAASILAYIAKRFNQPLIPAYIITGVLLTPVFGLITDVSFIANLSEIGIAFLLFMVGLEMDLRRLRDVGPIAGFIGTIQILMTFISAFLFALLMGAKQIEAIYMGLIITFSSTMVVVKLLSDKKELETLHGRLVIGILLVQDIFAVIALIVINSVGNLTLSNLIIPMGVAFGLILVAVLSSKYLFPSMFKFAAKSQELLLLMALSICFIFAVVLSTVGFSIAIGAFIAGLTLAALPYNVEIISKVKPLRDFFAIIFFVALGMELIFNSIQYIMIPALIWFVFLVILKPFVIMFLCAFFGYRKRTGFYTAISLSQISEFSLIMVAKGLSMGHISKEIFSITIIMALLTITMTSYFIHYDNLIYSKFSRYLGIFDKFNDNNQEMPDMPRKKKYDVILCGHNRMGYSIAKTMLKMKKSLLIIDYNPEIIKELLAKDRHCIYGDIGDTELIDRLPIKDARMIISTVPEKSDTLLLIKKSRRTNKDITIYVTANQIEEALEYYDSGADYVILPHFLSGEKASLLMQEFTGDVNKIIETKLKHIKELKHRQRLGHGYVKHHSVRA